MNPKRIILQSLTRKRLIELSYEFDADFGPAAMSKAELVDGLARLRRTKLEEMLPCLSRDELKAACESRGLDSSGREKQVLIDRSGFREYAHGNDDESGAFAEQEDENVSIQRTDPIRRRL